MFSSPLRGISISTPYDYSTVNRFNEFSSPLRGISISTDGTEDTFNCDSFRPLYGVSLFLRKGEQTL